jgi:ABC-type transport system involved in multi-copper enzyme maturation permease subunit
MSAAAGWIRGVMTIVRLTLLEAARRRLLWALVLLTVGLVVLTGWGFERVMALTSFSGARLVLGISQLVIFVAFMFSFVLAMTAAFMGCPAIGADVESGLALAMLARPLGRAQLIVGRWLGLAILLVLYTVGFGALELAMVAWLTGYAPPSPLAALAYLAGAGLTLLTVAIFLSTRLGPITGGAIVVVLYGINWMVGVLGSVGALIGVTSFAGAADVSRLLLPSDGLWRGAIVALEPPPSILEGAGPGAAVFSASPFFATLAPSFTYQLWCAGWVAGILGLSIVAFRHREI